MTKIVDTRSNPPHTSHYPFDFESNIFEKTTGEINDDGTIQHKSEEDNSEIKKLWKEAKELGKDINGQKNCKIHDEYISKNRNQNEQILKCMNDILAINDSLPVVLYNKGACLARLDAAVNTDDKPEFLFRRAIKEKPDYVLAFHALSERVYSHNDTLLWKYNPDLALSNSKNQIIFENISIDLQDSFLNFDDWLNGTQESDYWDEEKFLEKARMCVNAEMFETSLLFFNRCLWHSKEEEQDAIIKEKEDVLKKLSDHF